MLLLPVGLLLGLCSPLTISTRAADNGSRRRASLRAVTAVYYSTNDRAARGTANNPTLRSTLLGRRCRRGQLSYLYHYHLAPPALRPRARSERYTEMRLLDEEDVDPRRVMSDLPPLIKGYLRLGGFVGDGAVIDHQFNTIDVSVIVKTDLITDKYVKRYEKEWRGDQISG